MTAGVTPRVGYPCAVHGDVIAGPRTSSSTVRAPQSGAATQYPGAACRRNGRGNGSRGSAPRVLSTIELLAIVLGIGSGAADRRCSSAQDGARRSPADRCGGIAAGPVGVAHADRRQSGAAARWSSTPRWSSGAAWRPRCATTASPIRSPRDVFRALRAATGGPPGRGVPRRRARLAAPAGARHHGHARDPELVARAPARGLPRGDRRACGGDHPGAQPSQR